jgi:hypothetical protein
VQHTPKGRQPDMHGIAHGISTDDSNLRLGVQFWIPVYPFSLASSWWCRC